MPLTRDELIDFLAGYLNPNCGSDYALNGLQIAGKPEIRRVALGVSAHLDLFSEAAQWRADVIIVHHGLLWREEQQPIDFLVKNRLKILFDHDISLLAYHLPLDSHMEAGNNIQIVKRLGLKPMAEPLARYHGWPLGLVAQTEGGIPLDGFVAQVNALFGSDSLVLPFGPPTVNTVGIVSGGGASELMEAVKKGCDVYLTGEAKEQTPALCRESKINYVAAGHYNTEKFGVQTLGDLVRDKFGVEVRFFDVPNRL